MKTITNLVVWVVQSERHDRWRDEGDFKDLAVALLAFEKWKKVSLASQWRILRREVKEKLAHGPTQ